MNPIKLYLADDHQIIIDGLTLMLRDESDMLLCGHAANGEQAIRDMLYLKPDVAILDIKMPDKDGLQVLRHLHQSITTKFIVLSMHVDKRFIYDAMNYGASGYLPKDVGKTQLVQTIRKVMAGESCFDLLDDLSPTEVELLSPRELEVLELIVNELNTQEIADKLTLSFHTVETHRKSLMRKTGSKNLVGLVKFAMDMKFKSA